MMLGSPGHLDRDSSSGARSTTVKHSLLGRKGVSYFHDIVPATWHVTAGRQKILKKQLEE
jgi:hypothetical protein